MEQQMNKKKIQLRGNCSCCGRDHAVVSGFMSKHGYTVEDGWFKGVCNGDNYAPMQVQREITDGIITQVRNDVIQLLETVEKLRTGKIHPLTCKVSHMRNALPVAWAEAPEWARRDALNSAIYGNESRARAGTSFANQMETLVNSVYGTPLREVVIEKQVVAQVLIGDRRVSKTGVLTVVRVDGARIYWKNERGMNGWTGVTAWRKFPLHVEA